MAKHKLNIPTSVNSLSDNSLIGGLMVIITIVVSLSIVLSRLWIADIKFNKKVIDAKNQVNTTLKNNVDALDDLKTNFANMEQNGLQPAQVLQALPLVPAYDDFSNSIEAVAGLSNVSLQAVNLQLSDASTTTSGSMTPASATANISVVGTYRNLQVFLANLQRTDRPIVVTSLNISGSGRDITMVVMATTFYQGVTTVNPQTETISE